MLKEFISSGFIISCLAFGLAVGVTGQPPIFVCAKRIDSNELKLLLDDIKTKNPEVVKRLLADPELRRSQVENLQQLLASACQAVKDGALEYPVYRAELDNIKTETIAVAYDRIANKGVVQPPFASISNERIDAFYEVNGNEAKFDEFLKTKVFLLKEANPGTADREVTVEETAQAKKFFAKMAISEADSKVKAQAIDPNFWARTGLQVKLQQAQFLTRIYADTVAGEARVTDDEIAEYIDGHPEFDGSKKKAKAQEILDRAKTGEDFAKLANEFSDDPGNVDADGKRMGGLYTDVPRGRMMPVFENAALALRPGEISLSLVESDFGYHIIKLEKKSDGSSDLTYDVRHILISTTIDDPENSAGRKKPVKEFVRAKLENEKKQEIMDRVVADNPVVIAPFPVAAPAVRKPPVKKRLVRRKN